MDYFSQAADFFSKHQTELILVAALIFVLYYFVRVRKNRPITISRAEVERVKRIADIEFNADAIGESVFRDLFHGRRWLGRISNIVSQVDDKGTVYEIVFKPKWVWKLAHPTRKEILRIYDDSVIKDFGKRAIVVRPDVSTDNLFGIYYDMPHSVENRNNIHAQLYKTDAESLGDMYFAESQKRATVDLNQAGIIEQKQMDLQIEREKRARLANSG